MDWLTMAAVCQFMDPGVRQSWSTARDKSKHMTAAICFRIFRIWLLFLQRFDDWTHGWKGLDSWPPGFGNGVTKMVEWFGLGMAAFAARCT